MPNECLSEAREEEEGVESFLPPFHLAYGPSAQLQGLPAEDVRPACVRALFHDVLRAARVATAGGSGRSGDSDSNASRCRGEGRKDTVIVCNEVFLLI